MGGRHPMKEDATIMDEITIRENLKRARISSGLTQTEMAEKIGISVTAYQKIESGRTKILNTNFSKCAEVLGVSLSELVNGFVPVRDAAAVIEDVRESYGLKMRVQESGYLNEIQNKDREIGRLKDVIKDKEDTIATQKLLIDQLLSRLEK